jgi:hypothetical protein
LQRLAQLPWFFGEAARLIDRLTAQQTDPGSDHLGQIAIAASRSGFLREALQFRWQSETVHGTLIGCLAPPESALRRQVSKPTCPKHDCSPLNVESTISD